SQSFPFSSARTANNLLALWCESSWACGLVACCDSVGFGLLSAASSRGRSYNHLMPAVTIGIDVPHHAIRFEIARKKFCI
ncbi:MAG: hypothetical protein ACYSRZ_09900, partial [Planctomycetota bacterium]